MPDAAAGPAVAGTAAPAVAGRDRLIWPALRAAVERSAPGPAGVRVLDCGGGSGSLAVPLAALGAQVVVVDISIDALATLARRAEEAGVADRVVGVQADVEEVGLRALGEDLPAGAQFAAVLAHGVLEGADDPGAALRRLLDAVAPGGSISVVVANPVAAVLGRALGGDLAGALAHLTDRGPALDAASVVALCAEAGLAVEAVQGIGVVADLVPGALLESQPGAVAALARFEAAAAPLEPYRSIASRQHVIARRPG